MTFETELTVDVADVVRFDFRATNTSDATVDLTFRSGKGADLVVLDGDEEVWRWSEGQMFAQMMETRTIEPNEIISQSFVWEEPEPGTYDAVASLGTTETIEARKTFSV
jgi:hypothetical protein